MKKLTLGDVGRRFEIDTWKVQKAIQRGFYSATEKVGALRVIDESDLPRMEAALKRAGYLGQHNGALAASA